jgi:hypothetical protein
MGYIVAPPPPAACRACNYGLVDPGAYLGVSDGRPLRVCALCKGRHNQKPKAPPRPPERL